MNSTIRLNSKFMILKIFDDKLYVYDHDNNTLLKMISFDEPLEKILINCIDCFISFFNDRMKDNFVLLDNRGLNNTKSTQIINLLKCLQSTSNSGILDLFKEDQVSKYNFIQALYLLRLVDFLWDIAQSDYTGLIQDFTVKVMGKDSFLKWTKSKFDVDLLYNFLHERLILNNEYVLFNRFDFKSRMDNTMKPKIPLIFESENPKIVKILEVVNYIFDLKESNLRYLNLNYAVSNLKNIKISDNSKLIEYITLGNTSIIKSNVLVKEQRIFNDLAVIENSKIIFVQAKSLFCSNEPIKDLQRKVNLNIIQLEDDFSSKKAKLNPDESKLYINNQDFTLQEGDSKNSTFNESEKRIISEFIKEAKKLKNENIEAMRTLIKIGKANNKDKYISRAINNKKNDFLYKMILKVAEYTSIFPQFNDSMSPSIIFYITNLNFDPKILNMKMRYLKDTDIYKYIDCLNYINLNNKEKQEYVLTNLIETRRNELRKNINLKECLCTLLIQV